MNNKQITQRISVFHERIPPEPGLLVGYGAIIDSFNLQVPVPRILALISDKHKLYSKDNWLVFTPRYLPKDTLYDHMVFSLKYEGINLLLFKKLFEIIDSEQIEEWVNAGSQSQYARKIWFLFEWLMQKQLNLPGLKEGNYVPLLDDNLQYTNPQSVNSPRHRIKNNLPGTVFFCPLVHKSPVLEHFITENLSQKTNELIGGIHKDILLRTSAFLMLKDSKASYKIENENPTQNRAVRWGRAIGQAGSRPLTKDELLRLQQIVIENSRFVKMGYRSEEGFVGDHDRFTGEPIPEHVSAKWQDLDVLMNGLLDTAAKLETGNFHPVLTTALIAFGFVFIHPFQDGNGRLHRYLIHHLLASMKFTPQGIIFPVSASILDRIEDYRKVLESYSHPLLDFIQWRRTIDNNVEVLNDTIDYYRYFDATVQSEFLFECVDYTIKKIIPDEVDYLQKYDSMKTWLDDHFQMPDKMVSLLIRFLDQNNGILSNKAKEKEFAVLKDKEVKEIESTFKRIFLTKSHH